MQVDEQQLRVFLFDAGLLPRTQIDRAAAIAVEKSESLTETLVRTGMLGSDEMRRALSHMLGIPFVQLGKEILAEKALLLLPESFSRTHSAIAFAQHGSTVEVAVLELDALPLVQSFLSPSYTVVPRFTDRESITRALLQYQKHLKETFGTVIAREAAGHDPNALLDLLLRHALYQQAADVHVEPSENGTRVRYRMGGHMMDAMSLPEGALAGVLSRVKMLAQMPMQSEVPLSGRFKITLGEHASQETISVNVSTTPVVFGERQAETVALHFIQEHSGRRGFSFSSLGFSQNTVEDVQKALARGGLVFVCGGPHSGKTTLLYTLLDAAVSPLRSIATIEETIAYHMPAVSQTALDREQGRSPVAVMRALLRHDTDIIMLDCALDPDVMALAAHAANRGALVVLGMDAASPSEAVELLLGSGVDGALLSAVFSLGIGTRLVQKLCPHNKKKYTLSRKEQTLLEGRADVARVLLALREEKLVGPRVPWKDIPLYTAVPCATCKDGHGGMIGLQEVLSASLTVRESIQSGGDVRAQDVRTFVEDALYKAVQGLISAETLLEVAGE